MPKMSNYCRAYYLKQLRSFPRWNEGLAGVTPAGAAELNDDSIVYLHDNYTVTNGVMVDVGVLFDAVDDAWRRFCESELAFRIPEAAEAAGSTA